MQGWFPVLVVVAIAVGLLFDRRGDANCRVQIDRWARREDLRLTSVRRRWFVPGPWWLTSSRSQRVYSIEGVGQDGRTRSAVVRVGGYFLGSLSDDIRVKWRD
jgi:hypothetical protein